MRGKEQLNDDIERNTKILGEKDKVEGIKRKLCLIKKKNKKR